MKTFLEELASLINKHCKENKSNTPDYVLAEYLKSCLSAFDIAVNSREEWYGRDKSYFNSKYEKTVAKAFDDIRTKEVYSPPWLNSEIYLPRENKDYESLDQELDI
jgi:hypothetical protein